MKNFSIILFLFFSTASFAQKGSWGLKGGLNYNLSEIGVEEAYNSIGDIFEGEKSSNGW